ncbi:CpsD/CapB family tyrosine-protein kinase [Scatolibacter rhodanostii]|uniref:CpsD/CapB family tyrosine-protein kinase n=1 Tax=Scatolibacter rhodanostii TaxID=2014781 RepID=UPI000C08D8C4|nr:CpsD/CapB family tyrosine-protein kinase [Scatolibacter rhodanostii]
MVKNKDVHGKNRSSKILSKASSFQVVEAYNTLRANLLFSLSTSQKKSVIFTSSEPGAGKSTTCSNLALAMSQTGARVIILDADMRKPVQHKIFRLNNVDGLSKLLSGLSPLEDCLLETRSPNLHIITAGPIPPNPSELLGSQRMGYLIEALSESYDYIFIDTPPINVVADALMFLDQTAGVLLIAKQKQTHYDELQRAAEKVHNLKGNVLGVIVSSVSVADKPYKSYSHYAYESSNE